MADGRTVWDLLTDERSRNAVIVAEKYVNGEATEAAGAAARAAAREAQSTIIMSYGNPFEDSE